MRLIGCLLALLLGSPLAACAAGRVTNLYAIALSPGANTISRFAPDGRHAVVVEGMRGSGPHLYRVFLVMLPGTPGSASWNVVPVQAGAASAARDTLRDDPGGATGIRFVRGKLDGIPETFLITAEREESSRSHVTFDLFRLASVRNGDTFADMFVPVRRTHSRDTFCDADAAIAQQFRLPLPASYTGPTTRDGCGTAK